MKTRDQIKHEPVAQEAWRDNRTQVGGLWFDPRLIRPLGDHILVALDAEHPYIEIEGTGLALEKPQTAARDIGTRLGTVLAVGPGKWKEKPGLSWELTRQYFVPTSLKPGDRVYIGHYSDWESWFSDFEGRGANIVLCQEADVRLYCDGRSN